MKKFLVGIVSFFILAGASTLRAENIGVPAECEDVMLQAFYWNSYGVINQPTPKYGRTKWIDLLKDTAALNADFDLIWFPPSSGPSGCGVGYAAKQYSNQESDWGTKTGLSNLIKALHNGKTKVIADVVINHRGGDSWCTFMKDNFGTGYGTWALTAEHICKNDELNQSSTQGTGEGKAGDCWGKATGANDTGTNFVGARDLDHSSEYVQNWAKTYTRWLLNVMKYDGFRYDMTLGYAGKYLSMYNEAAQPYISVSEYWEGIDKQVNHLKATSYNTMIFDFPLKSVIGNALGVDGASGETRYNLLKNPTNSLRYKGYKRYAVTFIDNHDTFERSDNQGGEFIKYNADLKDADVKRRILEANAYILMMPGIPCVFYPHWKSYQSEISALIAIRKKAGLHSESEIIESSSITPGNRSYEATVIGHRGTVLLRMGVNRSKEAPEGYEAVLDGGEAGNYTIFFSENAQGVEKVSGEALPVTGKKFIQDGKLFIRHGEHVYDITGKMIDER